MSIENQWKEYNPLFALGHNYCWFCLRTQQCCWALIALKIYGRNSTIKQIVVFLVIFTSIMMSDKVQIILILSIRIKGYRVLSGTLTRLQGRLGRWCCLGLRIQLGWWSWLRVWISRWFQLRDFLLRLLRWRGFGIVIYCHDSFAVCNYWKMWLSSLLLIWKNNEEWKYLHCMISFWMWM